MVIALALTPVVASSAGNLVAAPTCASGDGTPNRYMASMGAAAVTVTAPSSGTNIYNNLAIARGNVFCDSGGSTNIPVAADHAPITSGGQFNALYAGSGSDRTTEPTNGVLVSAGSLTILLPLAYVAAILMGPVGLYLYKRRGGGGI